MSFSSLPVLAALLLWLPACKREGAAPPVAPPPPAVVVAEVTQRTVPLYVEHVAQTEAASTVEIRARVPGFLTEAPFKEGAMVKKGDLLFQIDPRSYEAALAQAQADLAKKQATLNRARADVARLKPLAREKAISQQNLDDAEAAVKVAEGDVLGSKAAVTTAELNLGYTKMVAPFDGMIGARQVDVGNFVGSSADTTLLATISTTDPMRAGFNVSETNYLRFQRRFMGRDEAREEHSAQAEFDLILSDGAVYPHKGRFEYADRALDPRTGTLRVVVTFPNPEGLLRPGQFARVRAKPEERPNAILVPQRAVIENQNLKFVFLVGPENQVEQRPVQVGERFEDQFIVEEGLQPGDRVIVEGVQKARPGITVTPMDRSSEAPDENAPGETGETSKGDKFREPPEEGSEPRAKPQGS